MGKVDILKKEYKGWSNCIEISNGIIDLIATSDVGPRLIRFGFVGRDNEFCEVSEQIGTTGDSKWNIYGGHRLWHSPEEDPRSYQPDNSQVEWSEKENGIVLNQPVEPWTQIKKDIEVTMSPDEAKVTVLHRLTNKGAWPVELSVWALSVMAPGGKQVIPQNTTETGLLPNRMLSLWPYTKLNDHRVFWGEKFITLKQDKDTKEAFKIGLPNENGWAAYANHGHLFVKQYKHIPGVLYPDFSASSYETYTCDYMMEMESLSPLTTLQPGMSVEHTEVWALYDNVDVPSTEKEIEEIIVPLIKK
ncbi:uncharacterized protein DUF4380 [Anaerobacterium chartisolvens]|uniref:Uncharacterized protein DUF4380 n=1 Tax=Anaerobacterium chartisolvens TaxID=1297424 RepID=A0A369BG12_9FIRM|nr:DUF4380 domain-containing protein [Anaerobacterium chartisolvens]RCX20195.1 uncharacterized protein DUF4380 [Anaerobacterium chartisolvens]